MSLNVPFIEEASPSTARMGNWHKWIWPLSALPVIVATLFCAGVSLDSLYVRLTMNHPQTPWEAAMITDGWRAATGKPVYESQKKHGHATHLYGALASQTLGAIYRVTGPSLYTGRVLTLLASLSACTLLLLAFVDRKQWFDLLVGAGLLLTLHYRCRAYFVESRPDMIGLLFATLATFCWFNAHRHLESIRKCMIYHATGTALIVIAFFFKQTYAGFAVLPIAVNIVRPRSQGLRHLAFAITPLVALLIVYEGLKLVAPNVFYYMIAEAAMYKIPFPRIAGGAIAITTLSPLTFMLLSSLATRMSLNDDSDRTRDKFTWLLVACLLGAGAGVIAYAKRGGSYNSLMLGWMPMTVIVAALIGPTLRAIVATFAERRPIVPITAGTVTAALILATTFGVPSSDKWNWNFSQGGDEYPAVVAFAQSLEGRVICPDDPTIPLFAKRTVGRCLEAELDANGRIGPPPGLVAEIKAADWMITVHASYDDKRFSPGVMAKFGYSRVPTDVPFTKTYALWKHDPRGATTTTTTTSTSTTTPTTTPPRKRRASPPREQP